MKSIFSRIRITSVLSSNLDFHFLRVFGGELLSVKGCNTLQTYVMSREAGLWGEQKNFKRVSGTAKLSLNYLLGTQYIRNIQLKSLYSPSRGEGGGGGGGGGGGRCTRAGLLTTLLSPCLYHFRSPVFQDEIYSVFIWFISRRPRAMFLWQSL